MPHRKTAHDYCRPPLFCPEEWREIITLAGLSPRQSQVLGLIMQSRQDKEITTALDISHSTVRTYVNEAKERMQARDRVGLVYRAFWTFRQEVEAKQYPWSFRSDRHR